MCASIHKWHYIRVHVHNVCFVLAITESWWDRICWFYKLGREDVGCKLKFVDCSTCKCIWYALTHMYIVQDIPVYSHFEFFTFFLFLKARQSPCKWNHFDSLCSLRIVSNWLCIDVYLNYLVFGRQNLHYFTYYLLQFTELNVWTHQTIINLIHVLSGVLILFICQDSVRV